jgi:hypothetical protein
MNITKISKIGHSTLRTSRFNVDSGIMSLEYSQFGKKIKSVFITKFQFIFEEHAAASSSVEEMYPDRIVGVENPP